MDAPEAHVASVAEAHARLVRAIEHLTDERMRRPTRLPGWTAGHVLTHLARNADSHVFRSGAARRGEVVDQYPGGSEGRAAAIEEGAHRSAAEIIEDVRRSASMVDETW